jgi:uncharacterized protein VirK/YbjX
MAIKHLTPRTFNEILDLLSETSEEDKLYEMNENNLLTLDEKIRMFKNLSIEKKMGMLKKYYNVEILSKKDISEFSNSLSNTKKLQIFFRSISFVKRREFLKFCNYRFLKNKNLI